MIEPTQIHEVHGSVLKSFQGCRLQYKWNFVDGYSAPITPAPLEFGSAFHIGMETLYDPETWSLPLNELYQLAKDEFTKVCLAQLRTYLERAELYQLDPEAETEYNERITLGCGMLKKVARTMDRKNFTPVLVEKEAFVPIYFPGTEIQLQCKCDDCWHKYLESGLSVQEKDFDFWDGLPVFYGFRVDAVLVDSQGRYWLVDWKSAAQLLKDQTILELDNQVGSYLWALRYMTKLDLQGFQYVQILKDYPKPPKRLVRSRLGRSFSVTKNARTDAVTFKSTVEKRDPSAYQQGLYNEHIAWLKKFGPQFIKWHTIHKTDEQLAVIGEDLTYAIIDLLNDPRIYPTGGRITCAQCRFQEPCLERQSGGDYVEILNTQYEKMEPYYVIQRERRRADT